MPKLTLSQLQNKMTEYQISSSENETLILGISGGIDSMVMLDLFLRLSSQKKIKLVVAHINHRQRGKESDADEKWLKKFAQQKQILFESIRLKKSIFKSGNFQSIAREARYHFFYELSKKYRSSKILTAHQADDQVESFFLKLLKGSSTEGLKGIEPVRPLLENQKRKNPVLLIRPLLSFSRQEIYEYAKSFSIQWREDRSNSKQDYLRNALRHEFVKWAKQKNPKFIELTQATLQQLHEENQWINEQVVSISQELFLIKNKSIYIDINRLRKIHKVIRMRIYRQAFVRLKMNLQHIFRKHYEAIDFMLIHQKRKMKISLPQWFGVALEGDFIKIKKWATARPTLKSGFFS